MRVCAAGQGREGTHTANEEDMNNRLKFSRDQIRRYFTSRLPEQVIHDRVQVNVRCPFHDDRKPSMSLNLDEGIWNCHGPCDEGGGLLDFERKFSKRGDGEAWAAIYSAMGIEQPENGGKDYAEPEATYPYTDADGEFLYEFLRYPGKQFKVRRPDGQGGWIWNLHGVDRVLYNLPQAIAARFILVTEGEKDADTLTLKLGLEKCRIKGGSTIAATTNPFGAGNWRPEFAEYLEGKIVLVFYDDDPAGLGNL